MEEYKRAWIRSNSVEPEEIKIIKKTKKESRIWVDSANSKTISNELIFESYESCLKNCIMLNYRYLEVASKHCFEMMGKIKKQEAELDAERSK